MKKISIIILTIVFSMRLYAQCISVELAVSWEKNDGYFKEDTSCCIPHLSITYRNNTDDHLYLKKLTNSERGFPKMSYISTVRYDYSKIPNKQDYSNDDFIIMLSDSSWEIGDPEEIYTEHASHIVNGYIAHWNEYVYMTYIKQKKYNFRFFKESDFSSQYISDYAKNKFLFLKPGEVYIDKYNLFAFQLAGGKYTFQFYQNSLQEEVELKSQRDEVKKVYFSPMLKLPKEINGYKLYHGRFKSNKLTLKF